MSLKFPRTKLLAAAVVVLAAGAVAASLPGAAAASKTGDRLPQAASGAVRTAMIAADDEAPSPGGLEAGRPLRRGRPPVPGGPHPGPFPPHGGPLTLARNLAAAETAVGIRPNQMDAWRDFTDAFQAAVPPPPGRPPRPDAPAPAAAGADVPAPFALITALATRDEEAGKAGARLKQAVEALRTQLTPEQLERLARIEPSLLPPPPPGPPDRLPPR